MNECLNGKFPAGSRVQSSLVHPCFSSSPSPLKQISSRYFVLGYTWSFFFSRGGVSVRQVKPQFMMVVSAMASSSLLCDLGQVTWSLGSPGICEKRVIIPPTPGLCEVLKTYYSKWSLTEDEERRRNWRCCHSIGFGRRSPFWNVQPFVSGGSHWHAGRWLRGSYTDSLSLAG